jgi:WbqC-like protein
VTRVAIQQPNYFPWLGYFAKIARADVFVLLDDVAYQSGNATSVTNRARIKTANGPHLLSVPVKRSPDLVIRDARIDGQRWRRKHLDTVRFAYSRSGFFAEVLPIVEEVLGVDSERLADLNEQGIRRASAYLGLTTPFVLSSALKLESTEKNLRILEICDRLKAGVYLSGSGARRYNDERLFADRGVGLEYTAFAGREYPQLHGEFVPNLSVVDALFNVGPGAVRLLK